MSSRALTLLLSMAFTCGLRGQVVSDFEQDADGWIVADLPLALGNPPSVNNTFPVTYSATGGNPGGHISRADPTALWFHFAAPAKFLGDKSSYYGGRLTYDMSTTANDGVLYPAVILVGAGKALYYPASWPLTTFTFFDIPLLPAGWKVGSYTQGPEPTAEEMGEILADLQAIYIDGDWSSINEVSRLDNVRLLPPVPMVVIGTINSFDFNPVTREVKILFTPEMDGTFQLESNPDLDPDPAQWTPAGAAVSGSTGVQLMFQTTIGEEPRNFFRVRGM